MRVRRNIALGFASLGFAMATQAIVNDASNPYHPIVERNVFGLKEPPPPPSNEPPKPPPPNITLTGITDVLGRKLALLEWIEPTVPGQPATNKKNYSTLTEGQREGQIEILEINVKTGTVRVSNYGQTNTLTFKEAPKSPGAPYAPPAVGGVPSPTASIPPPAPSQPSSFSTTTVGASAGASSASSSGLKQIPSRQLRLPTTAAQPQTTQPQGTAQPAQPTQQLSKEEQEILIEVERELNKDNPAHPPPPPTSLNPSPPPPATPASPK